MRTIEIKQGDDGEIIITSDEDGIPQTFHTSAIEDAGEQILFAISEFLNFETRELLNLDWDEIDADADSEDFFDFWD